MVMAVPNTSDNIINNPNFLDLLKCEPILLPILNMAESVPTLNNAVPKIKNTVEILNRIKSNDDNGDTVSPRIITMTAIGSTAIELSFNFARIVFDKFFSFVYTLLIT